MKFIKINGIKIVLDNVLRAEVEENFDGQGERIQLFAEDSEDPLELLVFDAASIQEQIENIISN